MMLMCPCIIDFIGGNGLQGAHTVVLYCDGDFNWLGQVFFGGGGGFDPSLAVR